MAKFPAAFGDRVIDKMPFGDQQAFLPEPADATTEKLRSSPLAVASEFPSRGFTIFPDCLSQRTSADAPAPNLTSRRRCRSATSRVDRARCNQRPDGFHLSFENPSALHFSEIGKDVGMRAYCFNGQLWRDVSYRAAYMSALYLRRRRACAGPANNLELHRCAFDQIVVEIGMLSRLWSELVL